MAEACTRTIDSNDGPAIESYQLANDEDESAKKIDDLIQLIHNTKRRLTEYNCILGQELANRKLMCYKDKCSDCSSQMLDMYVVFECASCKRKNCETTSAFVKQYEKKLNCNKDWINFLIKLARLYMKYPKVKYSTMPLDKIKNYMKDLWELMSRDSEEWQNVVVV